MGNVFERIKLFILCVICISIRIKIFKKELNLRGYVARLNTLSRKENMHTQRDIFHIEIKNSRWGTNRTEGH